MQFHFDIQFQKSSNGARRRSLAMAVAAVGTLWRTVSRRIRAMNKLGTTIVAAALAFGGSIAFAQTFPNVPPTVDATAQSQENPNYGVCHGTDPSCYHNWGVQRQKKVLLF